MSNKLIAFLIMEYIIMFTVALVDSKWALALYWAGAAILTMGVYLLGV